MDMVKATKVYDYIKERTDRKIRISSDSYDNLMKFLNLKIVEGVEQILSSLPVKKKGEHKGEFKRLTIKNIDVEPLLNELESSLFSNEKNSELSDEEETEEYIVELNENDKEYIEDEETEEIELER